MSAHDILQAAARHMQDRAATYDKPEGKRSMGATVAAFSAVTGHKLTEEQGWLFMVLLKAVRSQQGNYRADNYEDLSAYGALMGEAACEERNGGWTPQAIEAAAFKDACDSADVEWPDESRIDIIGPNGNEGLHYDQKTWQLNYGKRPDLPAGTLVEVSFRHQCPLGICDVSDVDIVDMWQWALSGSDWDIISWRIATQEKP